MGIIALSGRLGSGKDTFALMLKAAVAELLVPDAWKAYIISDTPWLVEDVQLSKVSGYQTKRWAGALKQIVAILIGCTVEQLEDRDFKDSTLGPEWKHLVAAGTNQPLDIKPFINAPEIHRDYTVREVLQRVGTDCIRDWLHPNAWVNALMSQYKAFDKGKAHDMKVFGELYRHAECKNCKKSYSGYKRQYLCKECIEDDSVQFYPNWIIPDTRFPNEADAVKQRGGLVFRVERDGIYSNYCQFIKSGKGNYSDLNSNQDCMSYDLFYRQDLKFRNRFLNTVPNHESETALDSFNQFDEVITNNGTLEELYDKAKQIVEKYQLHK